MTSLRIIEYISISNRIIVVVVCSELKITHETMHTLEQEKIALNSKTEHLTSNMAVFDNFKAISAVNCYHSPEMILENRFCSPWIWRNQKLKSKCHRYYVNANSFWLKIKIYRPQLVNCEIVWWKLKQKQNVLRRRRNELRRCKLEVVFDVSDDFR